jgi:PhzF family phenazine biosynthesis protein
MELPFYQVDAFTSTPLAGNPAAVVPLETWLDDDLLQRIARENNLSETAFFVATGDDRYHIRWMTPTTEVSLCGHATLASMHVLATEIRKRGADALVFQSRSGELPVAREENGRITLDFPSDPPHPIPTPPTIEKALGARPREVVEAWSWVAVFDDAQVVRDLTPDMGALLHEVERGAVIATAPGDVEGVDFVSRFFGPRVGVPEDPVTGSAHCTLGPYWAERLGRRNLLAHQVSARGGVLHVRPEGDRTLVGGDAVTVIRGTLHLP